MRLLALVQAVAVALALLPTGGRGFVRSSEWWTGAWGDDPDTEVGQQLRSGGLPRSCNPFALKFRTDDIAPVRELTGPLAPKRLNTSLLVPSDSANVQQNWSALERSSKILFLGDSIVYFDSCMQVSNDGASCEKSSSDGRIFVWSLGMPEQAREIFKDDFSPGIATCDFDVSGAPAVPGDTVLSELCYIFRLFQKPYPESRRLLTFDSWHPHSLSASPGARYVAWVENVAGSFDSGSVLRLYDRWNDFMVAQGDVNGNELLVEADYWRDERGHKIETTDSQGSQLAVKRSHPVFCGDEFLLYEARLANCSVGDELADPAECPPSIILRSLQEGGDRRAETLALGAQFPVTSLASPRMHEDSLGLHMCTAAWVDAGKANGSFLPGHQSISVLRLPSRESTSVSVLQWGDGTFDSIFDQALSGDQLFVVVFSAELGLYKIRHSHIMRLDTFSDVSNSESSRELKIRANGQNSTLIYSKRGSLEDGTDDQLRVIHFLHQVSSEAHCVLESKALRDAAKDGATAFQRENKVIIDASIHRDVVIWLASYKDTANSRESESNEYFFELSDLDKDNDMHFDFVDQFPFNSHFANDADSDGYADEMDFIDYPMLSDDSIMYLAFFPFFCVTVGLLLCIFHFRQWLVRLRQQQATMEDADTDATDTLDFALKSRDLTDARIMLRPIKSFSKNGFFMPQGARAKKNITERSLKLRKVVPLDSAKGTASSGKYRHYGNLVHDAAHGKTASFGPAGASLAGTGMNSRHGSGQNSLTNVDRGIAMVDGLHTAAEVLLTTLTVSSIFLAIYPSIPHGGVPLSVERQCIWADFFCFSLFFLDFVMRIYTRNIKEQPTVGAFLRENWYDIPAMLTDIPLTYLRFPNYLVLFKSLRVMRLYRRFTQQAAFVSLMVRRPMIYLGTVVAIIILVCAMFIKIFEQDEQEEFRDYTTVLWFAMVTVTTVGYGDLYVRSVSTWFLTFFLMIMGIGLISTLSAYCSERLLSIGKTEMIKQQMKSELENRVEMLRFGLMHVSEPYNPLSVAMEGIIFPGGRRKGDEPKNQVESGEGGALVSLKKGKTTPKLSMTGPAPSQMTNASALRTAWVGRNFEAVNKHRSSTLNVTRGMNSSSALPVENVMQGAGGKFRVQAITSQADLIRLAAKDHEQGMLLHVMQLRGGTASVMNGLLDGGVGSPYDQGMAGLRIGKMAGVRFSPRTRLTFVLLNFSLHKPERGGVHNFTEMADELADIIFEPERPLGCYLEKVYAIDKAWNGIEEQVATKDKQASTPSSNKPKFYHYEFRDPLHEKLARIDDHCKRYGFAQRVDYNEIITAITTLLLMHDRVRTMEWAIANLEYRAGKRGAKPVLEEPVPPKAEMPATAVLLSTPQDQQGSVVPVIDPKRHHGQKRK